MSQTATSETSAAPEARDAAYGLGPDYSTVPEPSKLQIVAHFVTHRMGYVSELDRQARERTAVQNDWETMSREMKGLERAHERYMTQGNFLGAQYRQNFPSGRGADERIAFDDRYLQELQHAASNRTDAVTSSFKHISEAAERIIRSTRQPYANSIGAQADRAQYAMEAVRRAHYSVGDGLLRSNSQFVEQARVALETSDVNSRERRLVARSLLLPLAQAAMVDAEAAARSDAVRGDKEHGAQRQAEAAVYQFCDNLGIPADEAAIIAETVLDGNARALRMGLVGHY